MPPVLALEIVERVEAVIIQVIEELEEFFDDCAAALADADAS